ncbi:MAG: hypothetical protein V2A78_04735 [bacterium]
MDAQNLQESPPTILCLRCNKEMQPVGPFALVPVDLQKKTAHPERTIPAMGIACECGYFELRPSPGGPDSGGGQGGPGGGPGGAGGGGGWPASAGGKLAPVQDPRF